LTNRLSVGSIEDPALAYVTALQCLTRQEPFRSSRFGPIAKTVEGAVRRDHIGFAYDRDRICGVVCWLVATDEAAQRWVRDGIRPSEEDGRDGDTVILLLGVSEHPLGVFECLRSLARRYRGKNYMISRLGGKPMQSGKLARWLTD
jgi:hypothetical protein